MAEPTALELDVHLYERIVAMHDRNDPLRRKRNYARDNAIARLEELRASLTRRNAA